MILRFLLWYFSFTCKPRVEVLYRTMSEKDPWVSLVLSVISFHFSLKHSGIESIKSPPLLRWCIAIIWAVNNVILSLFYLFLLACSCNPAGTSGRTNECHPQTGNCQCLSHVTGRDCSHCEVGFFNLQPGVGCERYRHHLWNCGWICGIDIISELPNWIYY